MALDISNSTTHARVFVVNSSRLSLLSYQHPYWDRFYEIGTLPAPLWMHYVTGFYVLTVAILGTIGNSMLLFAFLWSPSLRSPSNMFVANLAIADFGLNIFAFPLLVISSFNAEWVFGKPGCDYYVVSAGFCGLLSILTMTSISIDRYCSITRWSSWHLSYNQVFCWIACLWVIAFILICPPLFGWSQYVIEGLQTSCSFDWLTREPSEVSYVLFLTTLGFFVPLLIIFVCYTLIIRHLIHHRQVMSTAGFVKVHSQQKLADIMPRPSQTISHYEERARSIHRMPPIIVFPDKSMEQRQAIRDNDVKAATTCAIIVMLFTIAWSPYTVIALIGIWGDQSLVTPYSNALPVLFAKTSAFYNPIVYAIMNDRFRSIIWSLVKRGLGRGDRRTPGSNGSPADLTKINSITGRPRSMHSTRTSDASSKDSEILYLNALKKRVSYTVPLIAIPERLHSQHEVVVLAQTTFSVGGNENENGEANTPLLY